MHRGAHPHRLVRLVGCEALLQCRVLQLQRRQPGFRLLPPLARRLGVRRRPRGGPRRPRRASSRAASSAAPAALAARSRESCGGE